MTNCLRAENVRKYKETAQTSQTHIQTIQIIIQIIPSAFVDFQLQQKPGECLLISCLGTHSLLQSKQMHISTGVNSNRLGGLSHHNNLNYRFLMLRTTPLSKPKFSLWQHCE